MPHFELKVLTCSLCRGRSARAQPWRIAITPATHEAGRSVDGRWTSFGSGAEKIIGTPEADLSRKGLQAKTGCVMAVKDVSFEVTPCEVFVVMGLSGSGKS